MIPKGQNDRMGGNSERDTGNTTHNDRAGILIEPNSAAEELAVLNPGLYAGIKEGPWPFLFRVRRRHTEGGEYSTIDFCEMRTPTSVGLESTTLIKPKHDYEKRGCEDPRVDKHNDTYYITYIAFDGVNAVPALATTTDFSKIEKHGLIGPNVPLEEAVNLVSDPSIKKTLSTQLSFTEKVRESTSYEGNLYPYTKDAALVFDENHKGFRLIYRIEPNIQVTGVTKEINDFADVNWWREQLRNIKQNTSMRAEPDQLKIGLGGVPIRINGRLLSTYHEVVGGDYFVVYQGGVLEFNDDYKVIARLDPGFLAPNPERDILTERDAEGVRRRKAINFPCAMLQDPNSPETLWLYSGKGDRAIGYRSTSTDWVLRELRNQQNLVSIEKTL